MKDYAAQVEELRRESQAEKPRVRIIGKEALVYGYTFAVGHAGHVVGKSLLGHNHVKVFTGTRIWHVPSTDLEEL